MAEQRDRHLDHDPDRIAALVVRSGPEPDDRLAREWLRSCPSCADLYADLVALSVSAQALPRAARPRDFTITDSQAARLIEEVARHALHDPLLVAGLMDRTNGPADQRTAERLVETCAACAELHADLLALAGAVRGMRTPSRTRDFNLTPDDAARLRPSGWRRYLSGLGSSHDVVTRPLAIGFTTLGLVGVLIAGVPAMLPVGSATSGPPSSAAEAAGAPAEALDAARVPAPAPSSRTTTGSIKQPTFIAVPVADSGVQSSPPATKADNQDAAPDAAGEAGDVRDVTSDEAGEPEAAGATNESDGTGPDASISALLLSVMFLAIGVGLFTIRWGARRLRHS